MFLFVEKWSNFVMSVDLCFFSSQQLWFISNLKTLPSTLFKLKQNLMKFSDMNRIKEALKWNEFHAYSWCLQEQTEFFFCQKQLMQFFGFVIFFLFSINRHNIFHSIILVYTHKSTSYFYVGSFFHPQKR